MILVINFHIIMLECFSGLLAFSDDRDGSNLVCIIIASFVLCRIYNYTSMYTFCSG